MGIRKGAEKKKEKRDVKLKRSKREWAEKNQKEGEPRRREVRIVLAIGNSRGKEKKKKPGRFFEPASHRNPPFEESRDSSRPGSIPPLNLGAPQTFQDCFIERFGLI